jgi:hypothetical protein
MRAHRKQQQLLREEKEAAFHKKAALCNEKE